MGDGMGEAGRARAVTTPPKLSYSSLGKWREASKLRSLLLKHNLPTTLLAEKLLTYLHLVIDKYDLESSLTNF